MIGTNLNRALVLAAVTLFAATANAQSPNASPNAKGPAAANPKGEEKKADKADDKKVDDKKADKADKVTDRAAKKAKQHEEQKAHLATLLKTAPDEALKQELRRHAERIARLDRIKVVAGEAKDNDSAEKANKLLAKENERHEKWMSKHVAGAAAGAPATPVAVPPTTDTKGGAK